MQTKLRRPLLASLILFLLFLALTAALLVVDVRPIGPNGSSVGLAALNGFVAQAVGIHLFWYVLTDWLGVAALFAAAGFALLGAVQLIKRRSLRAVDPDILALGGVYLFAIAAYIFFEVFVVNSRPTLLDGVLEASYPSSHTMLVLCILGTALLQARLRLKGKRKTAVQVFCVLVMAVTVIGRLLSGVHWFTDLLGGLLLGFSLVMLYLAVLRFLRLPI